MPTSSHLSGKVALVTGGSKGIGAAIALALAKAGASVASTSRSGSGPTAPNLLQIRGDVRNPEDAIRAVSETVRGFGGLDILVNNAGVGGFSHVADMTAEQWQQVIGTNLSGVFYFCHAAIPELRKRGGGWIINISSLAGKNAFAGGAAYCASKAGLNQFSEALMQEVRHDGIRVSYVMPGSVATEFMGRSAPAADARAGGTERPVIGRVVEQARRGAPLDGARGALSEVERAGGPADQDWKTTAEDVAQVVMDLIAMPARSLPSRVELRPSRPPRS